MKEIPLLFSTPMVQALLDKRKTQTRRLVNPQPSTRATELAHHPLQWPKKPWVARFKYSHVDAYEVTDAYKCRYGQPGDLLYVRESWFPAAINGDKVLVGYHEKDPDKTIEITTDRVEYYWKQLHKGRMIPSIHMPKEAARIWLRKTATKVERVCDISEEDAIAEGVERNRDGSWHDYLEPNRLWQDTAKASFQSLWIKINGAETWNNWVWANSFDVLSTTGKPSLVTENKDNE